METVFTEVSAREREKDPLTRKGVEYFKFKRRATLQNLHLVASVDE